MASQTEFISPGGALSILNKNKDLLGKGFTPAAGHYQHAMHDWDVAFIGYVRAYLGDTEGGISELETLLSTSHPETGFIPNMTFIGKGRKLDPEKLFIFGPRAKSSDYTQPPVAATAALKIGKTLEQQGRPEEATNFYNRNYNTLATSYRYFKTRERPDGLVVLKDPSESGRDSDHIFDDYKHRILYENVPSLLKPAAQRVNGALDYASQILIGVQRRMGISNFAVTDVMFNCIYSENLRYMSEIAEMTKHPEDAEDFSKTADRVEQAIIQNLWDKSDRSFYAQGEHAPIKRSSIGGLIPLILKEPERDQVKSIIDMLDDPSMYKTEFPVPTHPVSHVNYDPGFKEPRIWRGPVWINTNWYITRGLQKQAERFTELDHDLSRKASELAYHISSKTKELITKSGYREFYHPDTGAGLRDRVQDFSWSTLADTL